MFLLATEGLTKKYKYTAANSDITVGVPKGKIVGFVGENGSGKTTFIRMICGLTYPTKGSFRFNTADGKCRIGAIVEKPSFQPNMSARDNLRFQALICGADEKRIPEILNTVGLADTGKKPARNFSLGMAQRLGIGIALLSDPELLILDEPTNGLDPQGIVELRGFLKKLAAEKEMTLLISSHILSELSLLAEHYIFIHKGRLISSVPAEELLGKSSRELRFTCEADPEAFLKKAVEEGWAEQAVRENGVCILCGPKKYPELLEGLAHLFVTSLETREKTLEARYMDMMTGGEAK